MNSMLAETAGNNFDQSMMCKKDIFLNNPFPYAEDKEKDMQMSLSQVSKVSRVET